MKQPAIKRRTFKQVEAEGACVMCGEKFTYLRTSRYRLYCRPCIPKRAKEQADAANKFSQEMRRRAREERAAHA